MDTIVSMSQQREDLILHHALRGVDTRNVFWIDVGANDPINISVTLLAYMLGGHGINIEPQISYKERYDKLRMRDINLYVGISDKPGEMVLHGTGDTASMADDASSRVKNAKVMVTTLDEVFNTHVPNDQEVHFLKIDVEGFEAEVIGGLDLKKNRPWIIMTECLAKESCAGYEDKLVRGGIASCITME